MKDSLMTLYGESCNLFTQFLYTENPIYLKCADTLYGEYISRGGTLQLRSYLVQMKKGG